MDHFGTAKTREHGTNVKRDGTEHPDQGQALEGARLESADETAIVKADSEIGSVLPIFPAPPIDQAILSNMKDSELLLNAQNACSVHAQAGAYAKEFLAELKRRFVECKKAGKQYLGYKNFDKLCADKLEISARQVRNILNNNPGGRKGRTVKPRPSIK